MTDITNVQDALSLITKAEIDIQISTAKAFPRSDQRFLERAISMATMDEDTAEACTYAIPRGDKMITGPSLRLAEIAVSAYGNIRAGYRVISNDGNAVTAQAICHDVENNIFVTVEEKRSILQNEWKDNKRTGKKIQMNDDMQIMTGKGACAIAYRNAIFKVIPRVYIKKIQDEAKKVVQGTAETLPKRREKALNFFRDKGIKDAQICSALGIERVEDIDLECIVTLRGMVTAINSGEVTMNELFNHKQAAEPVKEKKELNRLLTLLDDMNTLAELESFLSKVDVSKIPADDVNAFNDAAALRISSLKAMS